MSLDQISVQILFATLIVIYFGWSISWKLDKLLSDRSGEEKKGAI